MTRQEKLHSYRTFLESKILTVEDGGLDITGLVPDILFPHQRDVVLWAAAGGNRAIFCSFGLGKTAMQLVIANAFATLTGKPFIIGLPLGVVGEFWDDAKLLGYEAHYVKDQAEILLLHSNKPGIYLSNYERIREGKFKPDFFGGCSFDEGDAIRNLDTVTTDYIMTEFSKIRYKFIATATPSPNDYTEILNYAQFLGIMDRSQALTRFFQRDSTKAGNLTLYPHKQREFWLWVRSWSITFEFPSEINSAYSDEDYRLPEMNVVYHEVKVGERGVILDKDNNVKMFADSSQSLSSAAKERRISIDARVEKAVELVKEQPDNHWILWHDLEEERRQIESLLKDVRSVYGSQDHAVKQAYLLDFKRGNIKYLATKPSIAGAGCNFQAHCHDIIFIGVSYKFKDFIQAIHRVYRFRQAHTVNVHIIHTDAEHHIVKTLEAKWSRHKEMQMIMSDMIKEYGLNHTGFDILRRTIGVNRKEVRGERFRVIYNDAVPEAINMEDNSVGMILTSIPFSDQYEYCESYNDMGHNDGNGEFFRQMDYLTPELFRILQPGRIACVHVKDRIVFSYQNGVGFTSLGDFMGETRMHFEKHGFFLIGKHFITTDVVRENNQTYRLGWTENSKDGTKMGAGSPELLLVFRKPPTDQSNAYADVPVTKPKEEYSRGRWQLDAHAYWKSAGDRLLNSEELRKMDLSQLGKAWQAFDTTEVYNFERHVAICEKLDELGKLPSDFMALPPRSTTDRVWDDVNRMHTLNSSQTRRRQEKHVCPFQFDIVDRALVRYSNKGDVVYDPFGGLMTVPVRCIELERFGLATELNETSFNDGVKYCKELEYKRSIPTLFNLEKLTA
jgi:DNA modification methylase